MTAEPESESKDPILDSTCVMCGVTFLILSPDDYADLWRAHRCDGQITVPRDLLRRLLLVAEQGDPAKAVDMQREVAKLPRWGNHG